MLVEVEVSVFTFDDLDTAVIPVMNLHSIGSAIGPSRFLVLSHEVNRGTNESSAIQWVEKGNR